MIEYLSGTHTQRRCPNDILGIFVRISEVQLNGVISYPNSMFKSTRYLSVSSLVQEMYFKTAKLVAIRGRQTKAMINFGSQYSIIVNKFDRHNHTFIVTETQAPLQTPKPPGRFRVCYNPKIVIMVNMRLNTFTVTTLNLSMLIP